MERKKKATEKLNECVCVCARFSTLILLWFSVELEDEKFFHSSLVLSFRPIYNTRPLTVIRRCCTKMYVKMYACIINLILRVNE